MGGWHDIILHHAQHPAQAHWPMALIGPRRPTKEGGGASIGVSICVLWGVWRPGQSRTAGMTRGARVTGPMSADPASAVKNNTLTLPSTDACSVCGAGGRAAAPAATWLTGSVCAHYYLRAGAAHIHVCLLVHVCMCVWGGIGTGRRGYCMLNHTMGLKADGFKRTLR